MGFLGFDILAIPDGAIGVYAGIARVIAIALLPMLIVFNELDHITKGNGSERTSPIKIIIKIILVMVGLMIYPHIFLKIVALFEAIAMSLHSVDDWWAFMNDLSAGGKEFSTSIFKIAIPGLMATISIIIATLVEMVLYMVRYALLAILYVLGPIAFVSCVWAKTASLLKGWFINLVQISAWILILRILQAVMLSLNLQARIGDTGAAPVLGFTLISTILIVLTCGVPMLTARIFSGQNLGLLGSAAVGTITAGVMKFGKGVAGKGGAAQKAYQGAAITGSIIAGAVKAPSAIIRSIKQDGIGKTLTKGAKQVGQGIKGVHEKIKDRPKR